MSESIGVMKTKVESIALASILVAIALDILFWDQFGLRLSLGLIIILPSSILLGYYISDRRAPDRNYSIGLYSLLTAIALVIAGLNPRIVISALLIIIASIIIISFIGQRRVH